MPRYAAYATVPPYTVSEDLSPRAQELGLEIPFAQMKRDGYTVLRDVAPAETTQRLREAILRLAHDTEGPGKGYTAALLLGRDPVFEEAVLAPKLLAMAEYMCGAGFQLSQVIGSVRPQGTTHLALHADQNWFPAPFPEHNQLLTACWVCDEFTRENGCTKVIPGTHLKRRHPNEDEEAMEPGAIPIECETGCVAIWDGSVWHGNYPRQTEGERVVLHITYSRLALRTVESYDHIGRDILDRNPSELATMLGRNDFFGTTTATSGGTDMAKFRVTAALAKR